MIRTVWIMKPILGVIVGSSSLVLIKQRQGRHRSRIVGSPFQLESCNQQAVGIDRLNGSFKPSDSGLSVLQTVPYWDNKINWPTYQFLILLKRAIKIDPCVCVQVKWRVGWSKLWTSLNIGVENKLTQLVFSLSLCLLDFPLFFLLRYCILFYIFLFSLYIGSVNFCRFQVCSQMKHCSDVNKSQAGSHQNIPDIGK